MEQETLLTSTVPRTLESKSKLLGFELVDVLIILFNLSFQNLIFGSTPLKIPAVFGSTILLSLVLFLFKRGKPDNYIQHFLQHILAPTAQTANAPDSKYRKFEKRGAQ